MSRFYATPMSAFNRNITFILNLKTLHCEHKLKQRNADAEGEQLLFSYFLK